MATKSKREQRAQRHEVFAAAVEKHLREKGFTPEEGTVFGAHFPSQLHDPFTGQKPIIHIRVQAQRDSGGSYVVLGRFEGHGHHENTKLRDETAIALVVRVVGDGSLIPGAVHPLTGKWNHYIGNSNVMIPTDAAYEWRRRFDRQWAKLTA
jgi:hypothetical protein